MYSVASAALMLLVATLAITAAQTPPPAIAELAPQAVQQIKDAPPEQSSELGSAEGGANRGEAGLATTTTTGATEAGSGPIAGTSTTMPRIERARVRRCVGDPPRQTEDPQSPPCVPFWSGDNGGATAQGVTGSEIVLVGTGGGGERTHQVYEDYFNKRFEFYGRRLNIVLGSIGSNACADQKAAAAFVDEETQAFGVIDSANSETACFHEELARRGVISGVTNDLIAEEEAVATHPFLWQYSYAFEGLFTAVGEMICSRLSGGDAVHSTDPVFKLSPRKFGIIVQVSERDGEIPLEPLHRAMARCGERSAVTIVKHFDFGATDETTEAQNTILQMKTEGVTSVVCLCWIFREQYLSAAATNQGYFPEWILSSYGSNDYNLLIKLFWTSEQRVSILGVTSRPPMRDRRHEPAYYAAQEAAPQFKPDDLPQALNVYRTLLMVASGIQGAGPHLTPETFGAALQSTKFPNPPSNSGTVGFLNGDHSMTNDFAEFWWSESTKSPDLFPWSDGSTGALCYVNGGTRLRLGAWPAAGDDPFFRSPCVSDGGP